MFLFLNWKRPFSQIIQTLLWQLKLERLEPHKLYKCLLRLFISGSFVPFTAEQWIKTLRTANIITSFAPQQNRGFDLTYILPVKVTIFKCNKISGTLCSFPRQCTARASLWFLCKCCQKLLLLPACYVRQLLSYISTEVLSIFNDQKKIMTHLSTESLNTG